MRPIISWRDVNPAKNAEHLKFIFRMQVMMIGHAGSGKTSYMAAMYEIMASGIDGFSVSSSDSDAHEHLNKVARRLRKGVYPSSSDILQEYQFSLCYDSDEVMPFTWYDYRGGALSQKRTASKDVADIRQKIEEADAIIVFIDGDMMVGSDGKAIADCRKLAVLIQSCLAHVPDGRVFPVSFVITKGDKYSEKELVESSGMKIMDSVLELVASNKNINGLITITQIGPKMRNVQFPFLFSMAFGILHSFRQAEADLNECVEAMEIYQKAASVWNDIASMFDGSSSWRSLANSRRESALAKYRALQELASHLDNVFDTVKRHHGKAVTLF